MYIYQKNNADLYLGFKCSEQWCTCLEAYGVNINCERIEPLFDSKHVHLDSVLNGTASYFQLWEFEEENMCQFTAGTIYLY